MAAMQRACQLILTQPGGARLLGMVMGWIRLANAARKKHLGRRRSPTLGALRSASPGARCERVTQHWYITSFL